MTPSFAFVLNSTFEKIRKEVIKQSNEGVTWDSKETCHIHPYTDEEIEVAKCFIRLLKRSGNLRISQTMVAILKRTAG